MVSRSDQLGNHSKTSQQAQLRESPGDVFYNKVVKQDFISWPKISQNHDIVCLLLTSVRYCWCVFLPLAKGQTSATMKTKRFKMLMQEAKNCMLYYSIFNSHEHDCILMLIPQRRRWYSHHRWQAGANDDKSSLPRWQLQSHRGLNTTN